MTSRTWPRAILHLDMDAFYVNVHILDNPEHTNVPLVVGGQPKKRGVVSSASYEARQLGIHSAMPTSRALRLIGTRSASAAASDAAHMMGRAARASTLEPVSISG